MNQTPTSLSHRCHYVFYVCYFQLLKYPVFVSWQLIDDVNYEESNSLPTNFSSNLKVVEFRLFKGRASEIQLVKFLLHNLSRLEQLVITKFLGDTQVEVENQLLMLPRSLSRVSIVFL